MYPIYICTPKVTATKAEKMYVDRSLMSVFPPTFKSLVWDLKVAMANLEMALNFLQVQYMKQIHS